MNVAQIITLSLILCAGAILLEIIILYREHKRVLHFKEEFLILIGSIGLTCISLLVFRERIGGTILQEQHGWPHSFYIHAIKDILDTAAPGWWIFVPGPLYSYLISDIFFYFSLLTFLFICYKIWKNKT